jgi:hypothetical protein
MLLGWKRNRLQETKPGDGWQGELGSRFRFVWPFDRVAVGTQHLETGRVIILLEPLVQSPQTDFFVVFGAAAINVVDLQDADVCVAAVSTFRATVSRQNFQLELARFLLLAFGYALRTVNTRFAVGPRWFRAF